MDLHKKANEIRKQVVDIAVANHAGHIAPSLSTVDFLTTMYYGGIVNIRKEDFANRDRVIFSKAHGCYALYAILADKGLLPKEEWEIFYNGSSLSGCVERKEDWGLEASCGALGHGLPMAVGLAYGAKLQGLLWKTFCIVGDGEMQEGSNWEALQFASKHKLDNLTIVVDYNRLQAMDFTFQVLENIESRPFESKLEAFGCAVLNVSGHDITSQQVVFKHVTRSMSGMPMAVICHTIKGYGLKCMEEIPKFHFRVPTQEDLKLGNRYE